MSDLMWVLALAAVGAGPVWYRLVRGHRRRRPTLSEAAEALRFARLGNDREAEARAREAYHDALRREGVL